MGKSDKKSKKKHKSKRKEHKEKHKDKAKKSKRQPKEEASPPKSEAAAPASATATTTAAPAAAADSGSDEDFAIPIALMNSKSHAPETPEEYQRRQSQIRREVDPVTGRTRLIKGDSEILEEIVSKQRHSEINRKATSGDGEYYEAQSFATAAAKRRKPK